MRDIIEKEFIHLSELPKDILKVKTYDDIHKLRAEHRSFYHEIPPVGDRTTGQQWFLIFWSGQWFGYNEPFNP